MAYSVRKPKPEAGLSAQKCEHRWLDATQNAWYSLFPNIVIILCFLHAFLKIRDRATKALNDSFVQIKDKVWNAYRAVSKASFAQQLRRLREWTLKNAPDSAMKTHTLELCAKKNSLFAVMTLQTHTAPVIWWTD